MDDSVTSRATPARLIAAGVLLLVVAGVAPAQDSVDSGQRHAPRTPAEKVPKPPAKVEVLPSARDSEIQERLEHILSATGWFDNPHVDVRDGVVFLSGSAETEDYRKWAEDLARNTQDVAAIVNRIDVRQNSLWDLRPARWNCGRCGRASSARCRIWSAAPACCSPPGGPRNSPRNSH